MDPYLIVLAGFGIIVLLTAWLPMVLKELPLSLPIFCVLLGLRVFSIEGAGREPTPFDHPELTERLSELVVIVALMRAGPSSTRRLSWRSRLLGWFVFGLPISSGQSLSPAKRTHKNDRLDPKRRK